MKLPRTEPDGGRLSFWQRQDRARRLRAISLEEVLRLCEGRPDRYDKTKWHTAGVTVSLYGAKFMNWTLDRGGGGAIDLVMQLKALDFQSALQWLEQHFGCRGEPPRWSGSAFAPTTAARPLSLPAPDASRLARVKDYLVNRRAIPPALLETLIAAGSLYADGRANAVFLLRTDQQLVVGAELRGTGPQCWRGLAPGSQKDLGFFAIGQLGGPVVVCESAIDAISCRALYPDYRCLSSAGARPNPAWLGRLLTQGRQVYCGFDADPTGQRMAAAMLALHPAIQRLCPSAPDWNDQLRVAASHCSLWESQNSATWKEETAVASLKASGPAGQMEQMEPRSV